MGPTLLIASPQAHDPFFERTVVLVWHHDENGAIGVVVNRTLAHSLADVIDLTDAEEAGAALAVIGWGGPVEGTSGTVLTRAVVEDDEGWNLPEGIGITRSQEQMRTLLKLRQPITLLLGYAGWGPGQLDREIAEGGWLWTDADPSLVFDTPAADRYDRALATLGLDEAQVWMAPVDE